MKDNTKHSNTSANHLNRRKFIGGAAATIGAFSIVPSHVLGNAGGGGHTPPSEKIRIACIGAGGMGQHNLHQCTGHSDKAVIAAISDVDWGYVDRSNIPKWYPDVKRYTDYKEMLDKEDIDGVIVATPDHSHAVIGLECMKRGKHVYIQKPLSRTVEEARILTQAAKKYGVITQMGNQGNSSEEVRLMSEWIWDGAIGEVKEVHAWTNRPLWPSMLQRPEETPPVPDQMDWDKWIGPAPMRPYHPAYHPGHWRAWWDFGTGSLGDMACHVMDSIFWALKLKYPTSVTGCMAVPRQENWEPIEAPESFPYASIIRFKYPQRNGMPAVKLSWYDGGLLPERPEELEPGRQMGDREGGVLFCGDKGKIMCGCYSKAPRIIPETKMRAYKRPPKTIKRVNPVHEQNWIEAIRTNDRSLTTSSFDFSGPFTESMVMGNVATRFPNVELLWDGENMKFTNNEEANKYVKPHLREGYNLDLC